MASFTCPRCQHRLEVPDDYIGKKGKCPKCSTSAIIEAEEVHFDEAEGEYARLQTSPCTVLRGTGGSIQTVLTPRGAFTDGIVLNDQSTLQREFLTIVDSRLPAYLAELTGVTTVYEKETDYTVSQYVYVAKYALTAREALSAFEIRFLTFDVWGKHNRTLSATEIADISSGATVEHTGKWNIYDENEASEHYASIAFVATVRTAAGRVAEADLQPILQQAQLFSERFTEADLEPTPRKS